MTPLERAQQINDELINKWTGFDVRVAIEFLLHTPVGQVIGGIVPAYAIVWLLAMLLATANAGQQKMRFEEEQARRKSDENARRAAYRSPAGYNRGIKMEDE